MIVTVRAVLTTRDVRGRPDPPTGRGGVSLVTLVVGPVVVLPGLGRRKEHGEDQWWTGVRTGDGPYPERGSTQIGRRLEVHLLWDVLC